jgi:tRNA A37 threonylcarbamoyladenosine biosynthesis protein TsaE
MPRLKSKSIQETIEFAHFFASKLSGSMNVVYLTGAVGCGKTLICREICKYFNIIDLNSASFQNISFFSTSSLNVVHCDFYLNKIDELAFEENILPLLMPNWLMLVEWSNPVSFLGDINHHSIHIEVSNNNYRDIRWC